MLFRSEQDMFRNGASSKSSPSSSISHFCLMAKDSKVSPTSNPNISHDDDDDDDDDENDNDASIHEMGKIVLCALSKNKLASDNFLKIMSTFVHRKLTIEVLETQFDEKCKIEREDAMEKHT